MQPLNIIPSDCFEDSLTEDVEEFLGHFQQSESVRFGDFSAIWRKMNFSDLFIGLTNMLESKTFSVLAMATAMRYFLPPYSFQIRAGGLYLMYGFYKTQPAISTVPVRLALKDMAVVKKFIEDSEIAGHHDVVYIFHKLLSEKAISFTAMPQPLNFCKSRKPKKAMCEEMIGRTTAVQELLTSERMEEIGNVQAHYEEMKKKIAVVNQQATVTNPNFADQLKRRMSDFVNWQLKTFTKKVKSEGVEEPCSSRAELLSSIKQKSYNNSSETTKSRRHRKVEVVEHNSGFEPISKPRRPRPQSLQVRTKQVLDIKPEKNPSHKWLLCPPNEELEKTRGLRRAWDK